MSFKAYEWLQSNKQVFCNRATFDTLVGSASNGDSYYYDNYVKPEVFIHGVHLRQLATAKSIVTTLVRDNAYIKNRKMDEAKIAYQKLLADEESELLSYSYITVALIFKALKEEGSPDPKTALMNRIRGLISFEVWESGFKHASFSREF